MKIFDATLARLERGLDVRLTRHTVLAGNLANVDTPGYKPKDVDFAAVMSSMSGDSGAMPAAVIAGTDGHHLVAQANGPGSGDVPIIEVDGESPSLDGNGVDLDRTMAQLAENGIQYGAGAKAASKKLAILRYVVSEGNG